MNFGKALKHLLAGERVAREGWNGKGMFLYYVDGSEFKVSRAPLNKHFPEGQLMTYRPHIDMYDAQGMCVPWLPSQTDVLANDWVKL